MKLNDPVDRFCGSFKLFAADGTPLRHDQCWMALALRLDREYNGQEILVERPDGQRLTVQAHANPIRDESGRLLGAINVLVDISDRKRAEDGLKQADRAKNEFLATLAHELHPLAPIRNAVHVLHFQGSSAPETQWALDIIERQLRQMIHLVDDLLDVARITGNKLELRRTRLDLAEVLQAAAETSSPLIEACGQELTVVTPTYPIHLDGDLTRLGQVIANLLNNAAKYSERRLDSAQRRAARDRRRGHGARQRHRHSRRHAGPYLRDVHAGGAFRGSQPGRPWHRSGRWLADWSRCTVAVCWPAARASAREASSSSVCRRLLDTAPTQDGTDSKPQHAGAEPAHPGRGRQQRLGGQPRRAAAHRRPRRPHRPRRRRGGASWPRSFGPRCSCSTSDCRA